MKRITTHVVLFARKSDYGTMFFFSYGNLPACVFFYAKEGVYYLCQEINFKEWSLPF